MQDLAIFLTLRFTAKCDFCRLNYLKFVCLQAPMTRITSVKYNYNMLSLIFGDKVSRIQLQEL